MIIDSEVTIQFRHRTIKSRLEQSRRNILTRMVHVAFLCLLFSSVTGCQVSVRGLNKSGSVADAKRHADLDIQHERIKILLSISARSDDFREMQAELDAYGVKLIPYFPESDEEKKYMSAYNQRMELHLTKVFGHDVVTEASSKAFDVIYYSQLPESND